MNHAQARVIARLTAVAIRAVVAPTDAPTIGAALFDDVDPIDFTARAEVLASRQT